MLRKRIRLQMNGLNKLQDKYMKKIEKVIENSTIELKELNERAKKINFSIST